MDLVGMRRAALVSFDEGGDATTLLEVGPKPVGVEIRRGRGRVIALASASMFQNRDLETASGAVLFSRLLRAYGGPVVFDEYHLGAGERRSMMRWLGQAGLLPVALQIVIVIGLVLWWRGARFGAPSREAPRAPETSASFATAIGALFRKSEDPAGALAILARSAIHRIAEHHRIAMQEPAHLADELRRRKRESAAEAVLEIGRIARATKDLAAAAKAIDDAAARATRSE
jgi:hypothetical protein